MISINLLNKVFRGFSFYLAKNLIVCTGLHRWRYSQSWLTREQNLGLLQERSLRHHRLHTTPPRSRQDPHGCRSVPKSSRHKVCSRQQNCSSARDYLRLWLDNCSQHPAWGKPLPGGAPFRTVNQWCSQQCGGSLSFWYGTDPGCEKNRYWSGSRTNFDTDPDPVKTDTIIPTYPDPGKKD